MNIAEQIKRSNIVINKENGLEQIENYDELFEECENKAVNIEQDMDFETTTYEFIDNSVLVICNSSIYVYGCKN